MTDPGTTIYTIPVENKYIIYAPLKRIAFIGNGAMVKEVFDILQSVNIAKPEKGPVEALKKAGLFTPDRVMLPSFDINKSFNPAICILMPTTSCNIACTYCYAAYGRKTHANLSWDVAKKAIDIAHENAINFKQDIFALSFHGGGEPTLQKNLFFKASEYARDLDPTCPISITTNAVWDQTFRDKALNFLSEISISSDGNKITQNRQRPDLRGSGTFSRVMATIKEIETRGIPYGIRMTVTKDSLPELRSNIEFYCNQTECNSFQIEVVYNQGRAIGSGFIIDDVDSFVEAFMDVYHYAKESGKSIHYSTARPHLITNSFCTATSNALIVTSGGEITACYEVFDHSHPLADDFIIGKIDLNEGAVLYPDKRKNLLEKISDNRESCKDCFCYFHCAGDCPAKKLMSGCSHDQFRCAVTRAITRELIIEKIAENDGFWQESPF